MAPDLFVPAPAEGLNHRNVLEMFALRAKRTPDLPALRFKRHGIWRTLTWRDWQRTSDAVAAGLVASLGVGRGQRVALMAATRVEWAICDLAIAMAGAVSVPIYPSVTLEQAAYIVRDSGAEVAIVSDPQLAQRLRAAVPELRHVVVLEDPAAGDLGLDRLQAEGEAQLLDDLVEGERADLVLQLGELAEDAGRQEVGAGAEDLAELDEGRAELGEGGDQALAGVGAADGGAGQVGAGEVDLQLAAQLELGEEPAEAVADKDSGDLAEAGDVLGAGDQGARGADDCAQDRHGGGEYPVSRPSAAIGAGGGGLSLGR